MDVFRKGAGALYAGATAGSGVGAMASLGGDLNQGFGVGQASAEAGGIQKQVVKTVSTNAADAGGSNANAASNVATSEHISSFESNVATHMESQHQEHHHQHQQHSNVQTSHVESIESNSAHHNIDNNQNSIGYLPPAQNSHNVNTESSTSSTSTTRRTTTLAPVVTVND